MRSLAFAALALTAGCSYTSADQAKPPVVETTTTTEPLDLNYDITLVERWEAGEKGFDEMRACLQYAIATGDDRCDVVN